LGKQSANTGWATASASVLKNKSIPITNGFIENGVHTKIYFDINIKPTNWVVEYLFTTNKLKKITIDAQTGKIINTELINYIFN
jgi:hypothetical protein